MGNPARWGFVLAAFAALAIPGAAARAQDQTILLKRLVVKDSISGTARDAIKLTSKRTEGAVKGADGNPALLSGTLEIFAVDGSTSVTMPLPPPWAKNQNRKAVFVNKQAPAGPTQVFKVSISEKEPARIVRVKARGVGSLDISSPPSDLGIKVQLTVVNGIDNKVHRMCGVFSPAVGSSFSHKVANGVRILKARNGRGEPCDEACEDGFKNGTETDVDCGGSCIDNGGVSPLGVPSVYKCDDGKACSIGADCDSGVCSGNVCQAPSPTDGVKNGDETDVDCGGTNAPPCQDGEGCAVATDCVSGVCTSGICQVPTCVDGVKNGTEGDVDCGGSCPACPPGSSCNTGTDCDSGICNAGICDPCGPADGVKNCDETGIDCGGTGAPPCPNGTPCNVNSDCATNNCFGGICFDPYCGDLIKNGDETDIDCGGVCPPCVFGKTCSIDSDCQSLRCLGGTCQLPSCDDGIKNGNEGDIDCGGGSCFPCLPLQTCNGPLDCDSFVCTAGICQYPSCTDAVKNGQETDVDCGGDTAGSTCPDCAKFKLCFVNDDCISNVCDGVCVCGNQNFTFNISSNNGGSVDPAEWPGGTQMQSSSLGCSVTINRPSGNLDLVGNLGDKFSVNTWSEFSSCFGTGGEDGDGCSPGGCPPAGIGSCEANRPSCSAALNGSGSASFGVQCVD